MCKEFKVDEEFQIGMKRAKVIKSHYNGMCTGCIFEHFGDCDNATMDAMVGQCSDRDREDKTDVIFVFTNDK